MNIKKYIFFIIVLSFTSNSYANSKAGIVILSKGNFYAIGKDKIKRILKRRSPVFPGDILETGNESISQVRFIDNAVISLRPNTSLRIDEYTVSRTDKSRENGVISLLKGGFRTITGAINQNNYKVSTNVASIGIRGTEYEIVLSDGLNVAAWSGTITLSNKAGSINLGKGAAYNFANISGSSTLPQGLLFAPEILMPSTSPVFKKVGQSNTQEYNTSPTNPAVFRHKKSVFNQIERKVNKPFVNPAMLTNETTITKLPNPESSRDIRNVNFDRLGLAVIAGVNKPDFFGGRASNGAGGFPVIIDNGYGPHELPMFLNAVPDVALWRNGTAVVGLTTVTVYGKEVSYGKWDATSTLHPILQVDPLGSAVEYSIDTPVYWITAQPTLPIVVANKTGQSTYFVSDILGSSNLGVLYDLSSTLRVDFDSGVINGALVFETRSPDLLSTWNVNLVGLINQNVLDVSVNSASSTVTVGASTNNINGNVPMVFTGDNAEQAAGLFNLQEVGNPAVHAEGVFILDAGG